MELLFPPLSDLKLISPELVLTVGLCLVLLADLFVPKPRKTLLGVLSLIVVLATLLACLPLLHTRGDAFGGMILLDSYAMFFKVVFLLVTGLTILISLRYIAVEEINLGEYYALLLFATLGMMIMAAGGDLISIYLGLELMSISTYVLCGFIKRDPKSVESSLKFFLAGAFTSGILLYGMALLYGLTGSTNLQAISRFLSGQNLSGSPVLMLAMIMLVAGFGFKIAAVPFHMWVPDVYEGAPTSVTAFLATGSKAAGFAAVLRVFFSGLGVLKPQWIVLLWVLSALTMILGNVVAVAQSNIKRMLAYSSVAHAGYVLMGFVVGTQRGLSAVLFYTLVYVFMTLGAFSMVILICRKGHRGDQIEDFKGMGRSNPIAAFVFLLFLLSLGGIPPTAGFVGKLYLFAAAIEEKFYWLALIAVVTSAISIYYYFKVAMVMYMQGEGSAREISLSPALLSALGVMVLGTLVVGLYPGPFLEVARFSVLSLF